MYFSEEQVKQLQDEYEKIQNEDKKNAELFILEYSYKEKKAEEFAMHGFSRRIGIMKRCIDNIFCICPPDIDRKPSFEELTDIVINLQAFILNVYGSLDNLAWIWVYEKEIYDKKGNFLSPNKIGFSKKYKNVRSTFSQEFQNYLKELDEWFAYLENFRHSLAHRIPLYVPPYTLKDEEAKKEQELEYLRSDALKKYQFGEYERLTAEIENLGRFSPLMTHSFGENSPQMVFHFQVICDWNGIMEISEKFMQELKGESN